MIVQFLLQKPFSCQALLKMRRHREVQHERWIHNVGKRLKSVRIWSTDPSAVDCYNEPCRRCPPISGRRGAKPFLFQTIEGRKILNESVLADTDSEAEQSLTSMVKMEAEKKAEESDIVSLSNIWLPKLPQKTVFDVPDSDEEPLPKKTDVGEETKSDALDLPLVMDAADPDEQPLIFLGQRN